MTMPLYYPVWIAPGRKAGGWSWGKACDSAKEADEITKQKILAGAPIACVVEFAGGIKTPIIRYLRPPSARRVVAHWEGLWDATEE